MESLNDMFFTAAKQETLSYDQILEDVQKYSTSRHADKLTTEGNQEEARKLLREFICQYILSRSYHMEGMTTEELCDTLYEDMAGISFLKKWIYRPGVEEVNVNAYDDIEVIMSGGRSMKIPDRFQSPQHAIDVTRRLLNTCGMVIDDTMPSSASWIKISVSLWTRRPLWMRKWASMPPSVSSTSRRSPGRSSLPPALLPMRCWTF